ncbi:MAG: universal stress protein [Chloroflexi bacterium]|nr:universal stress protein [Chloroflexota bacterium]
MADTQQVPLYRKIVVPFDGSSGSISALRRGLAIAKEQGAELICLSVDEALPRYAPGVGQVDQDESAERAYFEELWGQARGMAAVAGVAIKTEGVEGHAAHAILRFAAESQCDLIAIGHSGRTGVWGTLLGSTAARVVDQATCDVLVAR